MERSAGSRTHGSEAQKRGLSCAYQCEAMSMWMSVEDRGLPHSAQGQYVVQDVKAGNLKKANI